jgi:putative endonuclease
MKYFVYLLITKNNRQTISYVGFTSNLKNRIKLHNNGKGAKFTRGRKWILAYKKCYKTKSEALKNEYLLKKNYKKRSNIKKKFLLNK